MNPRSQPAIILLYSALLLLTFLSGCKKDKKDRYEELRKNVPEEYKAFVNPFGDGSTIGAAVNLAYDIVVLYDESGARYAWHQDKRIQGIFSIKDPNGPLGECKFIDNIVAAVEYPVSSSLIIIVLFDKTGKYTVFNYNGSQFTATGATMPATIHANYTPTAGITSAFGGPFAATGFEAAAQYVQPFGGNIAWHVFETGGARYARFVEATSTWGPITQFTNWGGNNNLFPAVGAASLITLGNKLYTIFISKDGSQLGAWHLEGNTSVFEGPWKIN